MARLDVLVTVAILALIAALLLTSSCVGTHGFAWWACWG